jgi:hypothetical protein
VYKRFSKVNAIINQDDNGLNLLFHQEWIGAFGQVIAGDFVVYYSIGSIYRFHPSLI